MNCDVHVTDTDTDPKVSGDAFRRENRPNGGSAFSTLKINFERGEFTVFVDPTKTAWLDALIARACAMKAELAEMHAAEEKRFKELLADKPRGVMVETAEGLVEIVPG